MNYQGSHPAAAQEPVPQYQPQQVPQPQPSVPQQMVQPGYYHQTPQTKHWSDRFLPELRAIAGQILFTEATLTEDQHHNTDLILNTTQVPRISLRVRKWQYYAKYGGEFTVRLSRPGGVETELAKIMQGWGTHSIYAFADPTETHLAAYTAIDLNVFRQWVSDHQQRFGSIPGSVTYNKDGSAGFACFRYDQAPPSLVIASSAAANAVPAQTWGLAA